jgi:SpoVK/Ycf46/Vps4 family AAA+-type ATPase
VFLEAREKHDLQRNSLVSVFLRALEYFPGLLFLTTNRVGLFDEAILSRVHVILHFPDLTDEDRQKIWITSFEKLQKERPEVEIGFGVTNFIFENQKMKELEWNGREIRHAFNTMLALAHRDARMNGRKGGSGKVVVSVDHIREVAELSRDFKAFMYELRAMGEETYAQARGLRPEKWRSGEGG